MGKQITLTYYVIADTEHMGKNTPALSITKHTLNSQKDFDTVIEYLDDEDTMNNIEDIKKSNITHNDFDAACRKYLITEHCGDYEQDLIGCILLTEEQFNIIQAFK